MGKSSIQIVATFKGEDMLMGYRVRSRYALILECLQGGGIRIEPTGKFAHARPFVYDDTVKFLENWECVDSIGHKREAENAIKE